MRKYIYTLLITFAVSCTNIDCPLDNVVVMTAGFYHSEDESLLTIKPELTITSGDGLHVLLNKEQNISSFAIPLRHGVSRDTLLFCFSNYDDQSAVDTLFLSYSGSPHFESVDCPAALFHTLHEVEWSSHPLSELPLTFEKVVISRSLVDYNDVENLKIYLRSTAQ